MGFRVARRVTAGEQDEGVYVELLMDAPSAIVLGNFITAMVSMANFSESWKLSLGQLGDCLHDNATTILKDRPR